MTSSFERRKEADAREAQTASQTEAFQRFLEVKHPEIRFSIALVKEVREYMEEAFLTAGDEDFEYALEGIDTRYMSQHVPTPNEIKAALIGKIVALTSKDGKSTGTTFKLAVSGGRMLQWSIPLLTTWTVPQLTELLDEIVRKRTLVTQSSSELQQIVESARPNYGYPTLPKQIVRSGTVRAVELNAEYIRRLNVYDLKKLIRLYGGQQVNARLAGKD
jgi:hypothetical protein